MEQRTSSKTVYGRTSKRPPQHHLKTEKPARRPRPHAAPDGDELNC